MKCVSVIVINCGGCICYVVIIVCELGILVVVGCGNVIQILQDGQGVIVFCVEGDIGFIFEGEFGFDVCKNLVDVMFDFLFKIMMNVGNFDCVFDFVQLLNEGVGLVCFEFIINCMIGVYFKVLLNFVGLLVDIKESVEKCIVGYFDLVGFYVEKLVEGISILVVVFWLKKVIVCLFDFKFNEYVNLIGGKFYELEEENLMFGFCGVLCYISELFCDCFELECCVLKKVCNEMGLINVEIMVFFVCILGEVSQVVELLVGNGLKCGENGLKVIMMCELLLNVLLVDEFFEFFDGFFIGFNDLIQLILGLDCDFGIVVYLFDECNLVVKKLLVNVIVVCNKVGKYIGICGQGLLDYLDLVCWLMEQGIESVLLNFDLVLDIWFFFVEG